MTRNRLTDRPGRRKLLGVFLATTAMLTALSGSLAAQPYPAAQGSVRDVVADAAGFGGQVTLPMGGSRILRFTRPIGQVMVGNPKIGDVIPLGERTLYVLGKAAGATSLTVMPRGGGAPLATVDVRVGYDVESLQRAMQQVLPNEALTVTAHGDGVILTGALASSAAAARAAALAEQYAAGHVVNLTTVRGAEQVMISVRVAEVKRSALQQLGLNNLTALWDTTGSLTLAPPSLNPDAIANLVGRATSGDWTFQTLFDALERRGFATTLAEPNLVALSGETAVFFAGGEFPVPVPQVGVGINTITIEYKQYGVSVGFTPTVVGDTINLAVAPEVSALDPANSVIVQGFRIPGLTTRRAKTTVELRNGQSFAIAGLIRREFANNIKGVPGAAAVPLFGALFRSTGFQNDETEVVIIITAHLAKPTNKQNLLAPTDVTQGSSAPELYLSGKLERPVQPPATTPMAGPYSQSGAANSTTLAAGPVVPPAAMLAATTLTPPASQPASVQPTIVAPAPAPAAPAQMALPDRSAVTASVAPSPVTPTPQAAPAPQAMALPDAATKPPMTLAAVPPSASLSPAAKPAPPLATASTAAQPAPGAKPAAMQPVPAAKPAPTLAATSTAMRPIPNPAPTAATVPMAARPAPAAKPAPVLATASKPVLTPPAAKPAPTLTTASTVARPAPTAKPAPSAATVPMTARPAPAAKPAPTLTTASKPVLAPPAAKPAPFDEVVVAPPAAAGKVLAVATTKPLRLPLTSTSNGPAASAAGR